MRVTSAAVVCGLLLIQDGALAVAARQPTRREAELAKLKIRRAREFGNHAGLNRRADDDGGELFSL
jgi:hypothetical protein